MKTQLYEWLIVPLFLPEFQFITISSPEVFIIKIAEYISVHSGIFPPKGLQFNAEHISDFTNEISC